MSKKSQQNTVFTSNCKNNCCNDMNATDYDALILMCCFLHNDSPRAQRIKMNNTDT